MSKSHPSVTLIDSPLYYGKPSLDALKLLFRDGQPAVYYSARWEGAYHHTDGVAGYMVIPSEMLPALTAKTLTDWLIQKFGSIPETEYMPSYAHDARVTAWCSEVRRMYSDAAAGGTKAR